MTMFKHLTSAITAVAIGGLASASALAEGASKFNYTFAEGAFVHDNLNAGGVQITDRDGVGDMTDDNFATLSDATGNGFAGRVSVGFGKKATGLHLVMDYVRSSHTPGLAIVNAQNVSGAGIVDADQSEWRAALGAHTDLSPNISLFAELGFTHNKVSLGTADLVFGGQAISADIGAASGSHTALDGKLGIRALVTNRFELTGYARYHGNGKLESGDDGTVGFSSQIKAGAGLVYHFNDRLALGTDYEFGRPGRLRLAAKISF
jgi:hypothetical protein